MDTPLLCITVSFHVPKCTRTKLNNPDSVDTCPPFQQDCPPSLLELTTWHSISAVTHLLALLSTPCQCTARKSSSHIVLNSLYHVYRIDIVSPWVSNTLLQRTTCWFPMVSIIEGFCCNGIDHSESSFCFAFLCWSWKYQSLLLTTSSPCVQTRLYMVMWHTCTSLIPRPLILISVGECIQESSMLIIAF